MNTIVLIEDNPEVRENTAEILELAGYEVHTAADGKKGVEKVREVMPDLIICDIMMPSLDGFGVLHILSKETDTSIIPFIFLTAKAEKADLRKGMNLGADDYLTKPFEETELLDAVESRLNKTNLLKKEFSRDVNGLNEFINDAKKLKDLQKLSGAGNTRSYKKKDYIFLIGSQPQVLYFINKGKVKTYKTTDSGKELTTGLLKKGDFFGYTPLIRESPYMESAVALEDTELSQIPRADFFALLFNNHEISKKFIQIISNDLAEREENLIRLAYSSVRKRVAEALLTIEKQYNENNDLQYSMNFSRENLASVAGTTTETLIRTLRDFKDEKLVDIHGREVVILERDKLKKVRE